MKKNCSLLNSALSIILGTFLFLIYVNYLKADGINLLLGIFCSLAGLYYFVYGVITLIFKDKMKPVANKVLEIFAVVLVPLMLFLIVVININHMSDYIELNAWFIIIFTLIESLLFMVVYIVEKVANKVVNDKITKTLALIFILFSFIDLIFNYDGTVNSIGNIGLTRIVIYVTYAVLLVNLVVKKKDFTTLELNKEFPVETKKEEDTKALENKEDK